jgi:hypothetical protein
LAIVTDGAEAGGGEEHHREAGRKMAGVAAAQDGRVSAITVWQFQVPYSKHSKEEFRFRFRLGWFSFYHIFIEYSEHFFTFT